MPIYLALERTGYIQLVEALEVVQMHNPLLVENSERVPDPPKVLAAVGFEPLQAMPVMVPLLQSSRVHSGELLLFKSSETITVRNRTAGSGTVALLCSSNVVPVVDLSAWQQIKVASSTCPENKRKNKTHEEHCGAAVKEISTRT